MKLGTAVVLDSQPTDFGFKWSRAGVGADAHLQRVHIIGVLASEGKAWQPSAKVTRSY